MTTQPEKPGVPAVPKKPVRSAVGKLCHYFSAEASRQVRGMGCGPYAAIVTRADGERFDLTVFSPQRGHFPVYGVDQGHAENIDKIGTEEQVDHWWDWPRA